MSQVKEHPLVAPSAEAQAQAQQAPAGSPISIASATLLATFGEVLNTAPRVQVLHNLATRGLTCDEFDKALTEALSTAKAWDARPVEQGGYGWVVGDKKGRDAYGPKQSTLASVSSNARQIFGALKLSPEAVLPMLANLPAHGVMHAGLYPSFDRGLQNAKAYLASDVPEDGKVPCDWTGAPLSALKATAKKKAKARAQNEAFEACAADNPQQAGEDDAQYEARIEGMMGSYAADLQGAALKAEAVKMYAKLVAKHGTDGAYDLIAAMADLANAGT